ncbi:MAG: TIGR02710 family CRISPR-associated protein [Deltaproteobacteria bacterium]|nr:TIGR02710 family CRISPR-associated protein [Deltaproteobacteria bacterium]
MKKAMIMTVGTGRTGEDIAGALAFSFKQQNPDELFLIVTPKSQEETLPYFQEKLKERGFPENQCTVHHVQEADDVEKLALHYTKLIREIIDKGFLSENIVADYTSGTKAMSAALVLAGLSCAIGTLSYVIGDRGEGGRVIHGTERLFLLSPVKLRVEQGLRLARQMFNHYRFEACLDLTTDLQGRIGEPELLGRIIFMHNLAKAYCFWDRFYLQDAFCCLKKLKDDPYLEAMGIKEKVFQNFISVQNSKGDNNYYSLNRLVNLHQNARRRIEEGKYDDATARIYRLFEYMAQVRLKKKYNIKTKHLEVEKLPESFIRQECLVADQHGKVSLGLQKAYRLLDHRRDALGQDFAVDYGSDNAPLKKLLDKRNSSILAHGFEPISREDCTGLMQWAEKYLDKHFQGWWDLSRKAEFPRLPEGIGVEPVTFG